MDETDYNGLTGIPTATQKDATGLLLPLFIGWNVSRLGLCQSRRMMQRGPTRHTPRSCGWREGG